MFLRPRTSVAVVLLISLVMSMTGCAKRVEVADGAFEAQQNVVLTFVGNRSIEGRIDTAARVRYSDEGNVYRARIRSVSEDLIVLEDLVMVRSSGSVEEVVSRLADARLSVSDSVPQVSLSRSEIERVDQLRFDGTRTLRNLTFWTFSTAVLGLLLSERS